VGTRGGREGKGKREGKKREEGKEREGRKEEGKGQRDIPFLQTDCHLCTQLIHTVTIQLKSDWYQD